MDPTVLIAKAAGLMTPKHWAELVIGWFLYSNLVSALPAPKNPQSFYGFVYGFAHLLAANVSKVLEIFFPWLKKLYSGDVPKPVDGPKQ